MKNYLNHMWSPLARRALNGGMQILPLSAREGRAFGIFRAGVAKSLRFAVLVILSIEAGVVGVLAGEAASEPPVGLVETQGTLHVYPGEISLRYMSDRHFVLSLLRYADGSTKDVTTDVSLTSADRSVARAEGPWVLPVASGATDLMVEYGEQKIVLPVRVEALETQRPLRFRNDILPLLTKVGCNSGKCHGAASGKDGFRLSLYGFDPEGDHYRLTEEIPGRRINFASPEQSLLVCKATGDVPHTGGQLIVQETEEYNRLVRWITEGAQPDPESMPHPVGIRVFPEDSVMSRPGGGQQILVTASYSDGSSRDVTALSVFLSNNEAVAGVTEAGYIGGQGPGAAFVMARFDQFSSGTSIVVRPGREYAEPQFASVNYVDELVLNRWKDLHIHPSETCSDEVFLRRLYLDTTGLLPTPEQRADFLTDTALDKRAVLARRLIDSDAFLDLWVMKLSEMLQIRRANGLTEKGLARYDAWLREKVHSGVPIDQIIREVLPATGSTFRNPPTSYYQTETTPQLLAENVAQAFLGMRIQCAQCHNHPFDRWTMDDYYGFASFFSQVGYKQAADPREVTIFNSGEGDLPHPVEGREVRLKFLGGEFTVPEEGEDYRRHLAEWLVSDQNPAFSEHIGNVLWEHFIGRGIVSPVDDVRVSNPASNPHLFARLGSQLRETGFNIRELAFDICTSRTYQLATQTNEWNEWDDRDFSHARIRRLRAEVLLDCIQQVTESREPLPGLPLGGRAVEVPDGGARHYFLQTFGRADRDTPCSCEVSTAPTLSQALHLLNGDTTTGKIESGGVIERLLADGLKAEEVAAELYIRCYCREPNAKEAEAIAARMSESKDPNRDLRDLFWALLNSNEFLFNH